MGRLDVRLNNNNIVGPYITRDVVQLFSDEKPLIELWLDKISYGPVGREVE
jgi:hypothetical protein